MMKAVMGALLLLPALALADGICTNAESVPEFNICAMEYHEKAFNRLTKTYNQALRKARDSGMSDDNGIDAETYLKESQKLWWKFKELDCLSPVWNFGSTAIGAKEICEADKAYAREKDLRKNYLSD